VDNALLIEQRGALVEITLNRPGVLNALNDDMRQALLAHLPKWPRDPEVYAIVLQSSSERAFCAGGDVRELVRLAAQAPALAAASFAQEYLMNWTLECFSKPTVSLIDGMVMGSGVGLMIYGTHRVGGQGFRFSMPETAIGLFPDVGVSHRLARLPRHLGRYLGLTGGTLSRKPSYRHGLITHCIDASHYPAIIAGLADADTVDPLLDALHRDPSADEPDELLGRENLIEDLFGASDNDGLAGIFAALETMSRRSGDDAEWSSALLADLRTRSPMSLHITLRHLDAARGLELRDVLMQDYRLAVRCLANPDFREGVRALLIDKDRAPSWQHRSIEDVSTQEIDAYFASLDEDEIVLPERSEMQDLRT